MSAEIVLILTLAIILLTSPFISIWLKLPISVVEIILGVVAGGFHLIGHNETFVLLSELGFLYLMLLTGMEVNLKELISMDKKILKRSLLFLFLLYLFTFLIVLSFGYSKIFIVIFPLLSIGLVLSIQQEIGKTKWLEVIMKVGVLGEVLSILVLTIVSSYFKFGFSKELIFNILILFFFLLGIGIGFFGFRSLFWWFPSLKHFLMPTVDKYYQDVRIAIGLFFIMIAVMIVLGIDVVLGAFLVGVFLTTFFDHNRDLEHKLAPFGFGFLITMFFIHVGTSLKFNLVSFEMLKDIALVTFIMIGIRILASFAFYKIFNLKTIIMFGLSLSMPLTLLIATSTLAYQNKTISEYWYNVLVSTSIVEVLIALVGVKLIYKLPSKKFEEEEA